MLLVLPVFMEDWEENLLMAPSLLNGDEKIT